MCDSEKNAEDGEKVAEPGVEYAGLEKVEQAARLLAAEHVKNDPDLEVYWVPHAQEIRLIEVAGDIAVDPDGVVAPFYFSALPKEGIPFASGIALIAREEFRHARLPECWSWEDIRKIGGPQ